VNFIRSYRQLQPLLSETDAEYVAVFSEYGDVFYHTEVRWLSRGTLLKRFLTTRLEIQMFMNEKVKVVAELSDESGLGIRHCDVILATMKITSKYQNSRSIETHF
jgi:hypothetical protein